MKKAKLFMMLALLVMGLISFSTTVSAQTRWPGHDVRTLSSGTEVFLYNVGTGRFLIQGGDWGIQGRLFYEDTGKLLTLSKSNNRINFVTAISTSGANVVGCNVPRVTAAEGWDYNDGTYTILFDANESYTNGGSINGNRNWSFFRVTDSDEADNYTYYMYETFTSSDYENTYLGAGYGESSGNHEGNPNGKLVSLGIDRAVWSTADPRETTKYECGVWDAEAEGLPAGTTTVNRGMDDEVPIFNVDTKIKLKKLYQWRIVTKEEVLARLATGDIGDGLSTNLTYLINDRGFERNDWSFFDTTNGWVEKRFSGSNYNTTGRYKYTWGFTGTQTSTGGSKTQHRTQTVVSEPWNKPLRLKSQWDSKVDAKFGFLEFEGLGTVSTGIKVSSAANADPKLEHGVYKVSCVGFYQNGGSEDHPAYFFVSTKDPSSLTADESDSEDFRKIALKKVSGFNKGTEGTATSTSKTGVKGAGYDFVYNKDSYLVELEINVEEGETLYFGLYKNQTAQSSMQSNGYYDMDWAGADQFQIYYLGQDIPITLDEDEPNWNYVPEGNNRARTIRLHRTLEQNQWNSFVYPMDLTAVQVRRAFGDGVRVAKLEGPGNISGSTSIIDFKSIALPAEGTAIEKGKFYIIMPENITSNDIYNMGSAVCKRAALPTTVEVTECKNEAKGESIYSHATYFNETQIPAESYVLGKHKETGVYNMYYLKTGTSIKGFRGWITETNASSTPAPSKRISINGIFDDTTSIDGMPMVNTRSDNNVIYDLTGRKVGNTENMESLSKGIYVVNGRKWIVK
ncbi:MAG: hypothetical protein IK124_02515 [Prevotella sp.]|nr:hypothetical protein [Prevotella sp.]